MPLRHTEKTNRESLTDDTPCSFHSVLGTSLVYQVPVFGVMDPESPYPLGVP